MFRLVIFINLLAAAALTVYMTFYWKRFALENVTKVESKGDVIKKRSGAAEICKSFSGCHMQSTMKNVNYHDWHNRTVIMDSDPLKGYTISQICEHAQINNCTGVPRCCLDCSIVSNALRKTTGDYTNLQSMVIVIHFVDAYDTTLSVVGTGVVLYLFFYMCLVTLRKFYFKRALHGLGCAKPFPDDETNASSIDDMDTVAFPDVVLPNKVEQNGLDEDRDNDEQHNIARKRCMFKMAVTSGIILLLVFLVIVFITCYVIGDTIFFWTRLKTCQTALLMNVSWSIMASMILVDFMLTSFPDLVCLTCTAKRMSKERHDGLKKCVKKCFRKTGAKILNTVGGFVILWWMFVAIYIEGVKHDFWILNL